jgi:hypothetical protein
MDSKTTTIIRRDGSKIDKRSRAVLSGQVLFKKSGDVSAKSLLVIQNKLTFNTKNGTIKLDCPAVKDGSITILSVPMNRVALDLVIQTHKNEI